MAKQVQRGAVSIFAVIFAALLLTILTVGFIKIMVEDQSQASNNDLSQSAYDASLAGVEDAKRAIRMCYRDADPGACSALNSPGDCSVISKAFGGVAVPETKITSSVLSAGERFDQAYTCVKIDMLTEDYLFDLAAGESEVVPLKSNGNFNEIVIDWFTSEDAGGIFASSPPGSAADDLPPTSGWLDSAPPVMRVQLIRPGGSIDLTSIDNEGVSQTVFIRPSSSLLNSPSFEQTYLLASMPRPASSPLENIDNEPSSVACYEDFSDNGGYSCRIVLQIPDITQADSENAFIRLGAIYGDTTVRVSMRNGGSPVMFNGVQPTVDSTGRASSLYRRVQVRLRMGDDFPYPNYAVDVENDLCKDYSVTVDGATPGSCTP